MRRLSKTTSWPALCLVMICTLLLAGTAIAADADKAAAKLVRAVVKRKNVAVITGHGKLVVFLERHFPWLVSFLVGMLGVNSRRHREV